MLSGQKMNCEQMNTIGILQKFASWSANFTDLRLMTAHLAMLFLLMRRTGSRNTRNIHDLFGHITTPLQTHVHVTRAYL